MFHPKARNAMMAFTAAALLSGCVSFGAKPPAQLLTLSATQRVAPGTARPGGQGISLLVADPDAPKMLDTVRVPVQVSPTSVAYVTKVQWTDTPRHMFQQLLAETISATSNRTILSPGQYMADAGQRLNGELVMFGLDGPGNSAVVTYDAMLANGNGTIIARQRFTASVPVGGKIDAATVGVPLNAAANQVAADVAAWVATLAR